MGERFYTGERDGQVFVREDEKRSILNPRHDLRREGSEDSFKKASGWSEQLALALLADATGNETRAMRLYKAFYQRVVTTLPERWTITRSRIQAHARKMQ
jgi:Family of unknown function (DUF6166)